MTVIERMGHLRMSQRGAHRPLLLTLVLLSACDLDAPTHAVAPARAPVAGKGPSTAAPTVTSVDPAQAPQDTTLDVTVYGSGFTTGARAVWSLNGDTTQVHVLSTRVVSAGRLVARIAVPITAPLASYDVEVMLGDGKKGVGAEMFLVTAKSVSATFLIPTADATIAVRGDGLFATEGASSYAGGACGVAATILAGGSGDATMQIQANATGKGKCSRWVTIDYGGGVVQNVAAFINVNRLHNTTDQIPIGATVARGMNLGDTRCGGLRWKAILNDSTVTGADSVMVTRTSVDTWVVTTQPYPNDKAYCPAEGRAIHVPVRMTIVANGPLP